MAGGTGRRRSGAAPARRAPASRSAKRPPAKKQRAKARARARAVAAPAPVPSWVPRDGVIACIVSVVAAALFFTTFSATVALGDSPESVTGIKSIGILHAPGYPTYVLLAHAFGFLIPIGSWATRANLFSVVCASAMVGVCYLLARRFGATRVASLIAVFTLATSAGFWFNAGFAKHYPLSGLLVAIVALHAVAWADGGAGWHLSVAAVALGLAAGAAWEQSLIMAIALVALLGLAGRRPSLRTVLAPIGALVASAGAVWVFVMVRAASDPVVNWGHATTLSRLVSLITQRDFRGGNGPKVSNPLVHRTLESIGMTARDVGVLAVALVVVGIVYALTRLRRGHAAFLVLLPVLNIGAMAQATGPKSLIGFQTGLMEMGYLLDALVGGVVLCALGIDAIAEWAQPYVAWSRRNLRAVTAGACAVALLVPSVLVHYANANHHEPTVADRYATSVLAELPPHAALIAWGEEYSAPFVYAQSVNGKRRDVDVISGDQLTKTWYREQLVRRLHLPANTMPSSGLNAQLQGLMTALRARRPVYLDTTAMGQLATLFGYRLHGLTGEVVDGVGPQALASTAAVAKHLDEVDAYGRVGTLAYRRFPSGTVYYFHERAHFELARFDALAGDNAAATEQLRAALRFATLASEAAPLRSVLARFEQGDPNAAASIGIQAPATGG